MPSSNPKKPQDRKPKKTTKKSSEGPSTATQIPVPEDPASKYAADAWASGGVGGMEDLEVPSGQLCLVRRPGVEGLMKSGVLHNVDSLTQIVSAKHLKEGSSAESPDIDASSLMKDPKALEEVSYVVDKVVSHCVVKPEVHPAPNDVTLRQKGVVYTDMIDLVDKMFIFNFVVGGTRDFESFRSGLDEVVGSMETGEGVPSSAE